MRLSISTSVLALTGLVVLSLGSAANAQQLVTNGGFETGDFTAWTLVGSLTTVATGSNFAHSGTYGVSYGQVGSDALLSQTLTTIPGDTETISFWQSQNAGSPADISVSLGGVLIADMPNLPQAPWTQYTFVTTATSSSEVLQFGLRQDPSYSGLDDISVIQSGSSLTATPEPGAYAFLGSLALVGAARLRRKRARK